MSIIQYICVMSDIYPFCNEHSYVSYSQGTDGQTKQILNLPSLSSRAGSLAVARSRQLCMETLPESKAGSHLHSHL